MCALVTGVQTCACPIYGLKKMFAGLIDADCARTQSSSLLQAGFDALWLAEDNALANGADKGPGSSLAGRYQSVVVAKAMGPWRLRRGGFNGSFPRDGINAFRLVGRGDTATAFLHLASIGAFGEIGRASCRDRVCKYVSISVVAVYLKK